MVRTIRETRVCKHGRLAVGCSRALLDPILELVVIRFAADAVGGQPRSTLAMTEVRYAARGEIERPDEGLRPSAGR